MSAQIWLINIGFKWDILQLCFFNIQEFTHDHFSRGQYKVWISRMIIIPLKCLANNKTLTSNDIIIRRRTLTWHIAVRWANFRWSPQPLLFCVRGEGGTCDVDRLELEVFIVHSRRGEKRAGLAEANITHAFSAVLASRSHFSKASTGWYRTGWPWRTRISSNTS